MAFSYSLGIRKSAFSRFVRSRVEPEHSRGSDAEAPTFLPNLKVTSAPFETTQHAELSYRRHAEISDVAWEGLLGPTQRAST